LLQLKILLLPTTLPPSPFPWIRDVVITGKKRKCLILIDRDICVIRKEREDDLKEIEKLIIGAQETVKKMVESRNWREEKIKSEWIRYHIRYIGSYEETRKQWEKQKSFSW